MKLIENSFRDFWDNSKCMNIQITGIPEEEKKKKVSERICKEIIFENFPNKGKEIVSNSRKHRESHTG